MNTLLLVTSPEVAPTPDVLSAWDQFLQAIINYKVVGLTSILALAIWVLIAVTKRWGAGGEAPNWWKRMPKLARIALVASLGALAGILTAIHGGANPGQAIVVGFSGVLSIMGHEVARKLGLVDGASEPQDPVVTPSPPAPPVPPAAQPPAQS